MVWKAGLGREVRDRDSRTPGEKKDKGKDRH